MGIAERVTRACRTSWSVSGKNGGDERIQHDEGRFSAYIVHLEVRSTVGWHEDKIASLRQARFDTLPPTLSRRPAEGSRAPVSVYFGDRNPLSNFIKLSQT